MSAKKIWYFIKFFKKEDHTDQFIKGTLYLNRLSFFRSIEEDDNYTDGRQDKTEAVAIWLQPHDLVIKVKTPKRPSALSRASGRATIDIHKSRADLVPLSVPRMLSSIQRAVMIRRPSYSPRPGTSWPISRGRASACEARRAPKGHHYRAAPSTSAIPSDSNNASWANSSISLPMQLWRSAPRISVQPPLYFQISPAR